MSTGMREDSRNEYRRRSPSPVRRRVSRSRSPPRGRYQSRTPERRRRYSRSPSPRRHRRSPPPPPQARPRRPREVIRGSEEERMRTSSIFVGNLPYAFEERDIVNLFERFGRLRQISVPMDRYTRRNRGFAFVEFEQRADAEDAYTKYENYEIEGRKLRLDWDIGRSAKDTLRDTRSSPRREYRRSSPPPPPPVPRDRSPMRDRSPPPPPSRRDREYERNDDYR